MSLRFELSWMREKFGERDHEVRTDKTQAKIKGAELFITPCKILISKREKAKKKKIYIYSEIRKRKEINLGLVGRVDTPGTLPLFEGTHLVGYLYLCPRSSYRYDYHHKKSALFIFIHPKIGITYVVSLSIPLRFICPPSILRWNSNSPPTNYYFVTALLLIWWMSPSMFLLRILQGLSIQPHLLHPPCFNPFSFTLCLFWSTQR